MRKKISVLTAFYNEDCNLDLWRQRVLAVLGKLDFDYEIVLIDDHSSDRSPALARAWVREDPHVRYLRLSRNCGSHAAFSAGLDRCSGDCAVLLAADLQDPPEIIPTLVEHWRAGHDVVWATRGARLGETRTTLFLARTYYWLMRRYALPEMPPTGADFMLMDRKVIDAYNAIPEKNTSLFAMVLWLGYRQTAIDYVKQARHAGVSKWNVSKKLKLAFDSLISFSYTPIRFMSLMGVLVSLLGFLYALFIIFFRALRGFPVEGWAATMVVILVLGGFQLLMLGVLGEYLWRTFDEARGRPRYVIEEDFQAPQPPAQGDARPDGWTAGETVPAGSLPGGGA